MKSIISNQSLSIFIISVITGCFLVNASLAERFFIRSLTGDGDLCMSKGLGLKIVVRHCDYNDDNQEWSLDEFGRLKLESIADDQCVKFNTSSPTDMAVKYKNCGNPDKDWVIDTRAVIFGMFTQKIHSKADACKVFTVDEIENGGKVSIRDDIPGQQFNQTWEITMATPEPSASPTPPPTEPIDFLTYTGDCDDYWHPCGLCEGECKCDDECEGSLRCAQRWMYEHDVPGCEWHPHPHFYESKESSTNFCFEPELDNGKTISYIGECGTEAYRCGRCQGDCETDHDCKDGLVCFHRHGFEPVPGCSGRMGENDVYGKDICVKEKDLSKHKYARGEEEESED